MDDLVSRIINVSMDLYFYYIPITLDNGRAFNKFRVYATRSERLFAYRMRKSTTESNGKKGDVTYSRPWSIPPSYLSTCLHRIGGNSTNSSHNKRIVCMRARVHCYSYLPTTQKRYIFFYVFSTSVHIRHRDQRVEKKQSRNNGVPLSERDAVPTYDGVFISYAKRWSIAHRGASGNVNRNILKRCLHGNN